MDHGTSNDAVHSENENQCQLGSVPPCEASRLRGGPRSQKGLERASKNAVKHGLTADGLLPNETLSEFEAFRANLLADPANEIRQCLLDSLVYDFWRLRRVPFADGAVARRYQREVVRESRYDILHRFPPLDELATGEYVMAALEHNELLVRYETAIRRGICLTLQTLAVLDSTMLAQCESSFTVGE